LKIADQKQNASFSKDDQELTISNINLVAGDADLLVTLNIDDDTKGPWQVDVMKR
jgi:hypothetical protein